MFKHVRLLQLAGQALMVVLGPLCNTPDTLSNIQAGIIPSVSQVMPPLYLHVFKVAYCADIFVDDITLIYLGLLS